MTTRILPRDEWPRLDGTCCEILWRSLDPSRGQFVVVEDEGGNIVACVMFAMVLHAEGLWITPLHRKRVRVWRRLLRAFYEQAGVMNVQAMIGGAVSEEMHGVLRDHLHGQALNATYYALPVKGVH